MTFALVIVYNDCGLSEALNLKIKYINLENISIDIDSFIIFNNQIQVATISLYITQFDMFVNNGIVLCYLAWVDKRGEAGGMWN